MSPSSGNADWSEYNAASSSCSYERGSPSSFESSQLKSLEYCHVALGSFRSGDIRAASSLSSSIVYCTIPRTMPFTLQSLVIESLALSHTSHNLPLLLCHNSHNCLHLSAYSRLPRCRNFRNLHLRCRNRRLY